VAAWPEAAPRGSVSRFCREHEVSRSWFYEVRARLKAAGVDGLRRKASPVRSPAAVAVEVEEIAVRLRKELAEDGLDHGPISVRDNMVALGIAAPSRATLARIFTRRGLVVAQPQKRPRSSWRRFEAAQVHQRWQMDAFAWPLAGGEPAVVFQPLDDRSRIVASFAASGETSQAAVAAFEAMVNDFQPPQELLTDNGTALNQSRRGQLTELTRRAHALGVRTSTGRPGHPQTQGKDERVHATTQKWLAARTRATTLAELQTQLDAFDGYYNFRRGHQALGVDPTTGRLRTPAQILAAGPTAEPPLPPQPEPQVTTTPRHQIESRTALVRAGGKVNVAHKIIQVGAEQIGQTLHVVINGPTLLVLDQQGELLRAVHLSANVRYYGNGKPRGGRRTPRARPSPLP
jgi:transposase InsO family protein